MVTTAEEEAHGDMERRNYRWYDKDLEKKCFSKTYFEPKPKNANDEGKQVQGELNKQNGATRVPTAQPNQHPTARKSYIQEDALQMNNQNNKERNEEHKNMEEEKSSEVESDDKRFFYGGESTTRSKPPDIWELVGSELELNSNDEHPIKPPPIEMSEDAKRKSDKRKGNLKLSVKIIIESKILDDSQYGPIDEEVERAWISISAS